MARAHGTIVLRKLSLTPGLEFTDLTESCWFEMHLGKGLMPRIPGVESRKALTPNEGGMNIAKLDLGCSVLRSLVDAPIHQGCKALLSTPVGIESENWPMPFWAWLLIVAAHAPCAGNLVIEAHPGENGSVRDACAEIFEVLISAFAACRRRLDEWSKRYLGIAGQDPPGTQGQRAPYDEYKLDYLILPYWKVDARVRNQPVANTFGRTTMPPVPFDDHAEAADEGVMAATPAYPTEFGARRVDIFKGLCEDINGGMSATTSGMLAMLAVLHEKGPPAIREMIERDFARERDEAVLTTIPENFLELWSHALVHLLFLVVPFLRHGKGSVTQNICLQLYNGDCSSSKRERASLLHTHASAQLLCMQRTLTFALL